MKDTAPVEGSAFSRLDAAVMQPSSFHVSRPHPDHATPTHNPQPTPSHKTAPRSVPVHVGDSHGAAGEGGRRARRLPRGQHGAPPGRPSPTSPSPTSLSPTSLSLPRAAQHPTSPSCGTSIYLQTPSLTSPPPSPPPPHTASPHPPSYACVWYVCVPYAICRAQTVRREDNPLDHALIEAIRKLTGVPMVRNPYLSLSLYSPYLSLSSPYLSLSRPLSSPLSSPYLSLSSPYLSLSSPYLSLSSPLSATPACPWYAPPPDVLLQYCTVLCVR